MIIGSPFLARITGNPACLQSALKGKNEILLVWMGKPIVTFEQLVSEFPRITNKSKCFAKKVLPLHASPELAALVAALMTDGHVEWAKADGRSRAKRIMLYSSEKVECEWFLKIVKGLFGVDGRIDAYTPNHNNCTKQPYRAFVCKAIVTMILILAGAPAGNKTEKEFLVPNWIMGGSKEIKKEFLNTFFTFEASKPRVKTNREFSFEIGLIMIKVEEHANNAFRFFSQIKNLLKEFGIKPTKTISYPKKHGFRTSKFAFHFSITRQSSIVNFYRHIGYFNVAKQELLKATVVKLSKFARVRAEPVCILISDLKKNFGTDKLLAREINKFTEKSYTNRQVEHFRRRETKLPLEFLFALIKIKKEKAILKELPKYVQFLYEVNSSALLSP